MGQSITVCPLDFFNLPLPLAKVVVVRKGKLPRLNINDIIDINQGLKSGLGKGSLISELFSLWLQTPKNCAIKYPENILCE